MDSRIDRFCPDIIHQIEKDDELSADDSDDENANHELPVFFDDFKNKRL